MTHWVDPEMATILERLRAAPSVDLKALPIAQARATFETGALPWNEGAPPIESRDLRVPTRDGDLRARLYQPPEALEGAVIVFVHGGGWTFGSIDTHDGTMRSLATAATCAVLGVDYRLAPEHPFPAPLDDVLATIAFVEAGGLGRRHDAADIAIAGDSAGANLALAALLARRIAGDAPLAAGLLFYGCYEPDFSSESHTAFGDGEYLLTSDNMRWYWDNFLGRTNRDTALLAAPLRTDLRGLPPLYISAAGLDPLRDDTLRLAERLAAAGVTHRCDLVPGVVHGCLRMSRELKAARDMIDAAGAFAAHTLTRTNREDEHHGTAQVSQRSRSRCV